MEPERHEVYERIPWETLEKKSSDRQWWVYVVAGAVTLGALAYSFTRNQPVTVAPPGAAPTSVATAPPTTTSPSPQPSVVNPVVVAEADLYAVDPEDLADQASMYAEWFAVEFFTVDGSDQSVSQLAAMLPDGVPAPEAPEGSQVFVDWVGARSVTQIGPTSFDVEVLVRSLVSTGEEGFTRLAPRNVTITVEVGDDGQPRVVSPPVITATPAPARYGLTLDAVPDELKAQVESTHGQVIGGVDLGNGRWQIVVMSTGIDGVIRPVTVIAP